MKKKEMNIKLTEAIEYELFSTTESVMLNDIRRQIVRLYNSIEPWNDGDKRDVPHILCKEFLTPVLRIIDVIDRIMTNEFMETTWIACIDEAEFLAESHLKCVNTFMRTTKKRLVLKMTTLPTKHTTKETLISGLFIDENGNDFSYRCVDYDCNSTEYIDLTNYIVKKRLLSAFPEGKIESLEDLLGRCGKNDDQGDYFKAALSTSEEKADEIIKCGIIASISPTRRERFKSLNGDLQKEQTQYYEKFGPAFYVRYAKKENSKANKVFEWFLGSKVIRKMSDGNPRRFIEIMNTIIKKVMAKEITSKELHRTLFQFSSDEEKRIQSLPEYGFLLKELCSEIGNLLSSKIHGDVLLDCGCNFFLDSNLLKNENVINSLKLGIDYNHIKFVNNNHQVISFDSHLRLSYLHAVVHWLPMRVVDNPAPIIRPKHLNFEFSGDLFNRENAKKLIKYYQLELTNVD